ncbi:GGDEF domain-containing protein [Actinoplanes sp. NEAU-A11]|uniref:GGDEF domain-containing protein n=1 Tax=Actinoplanes aureus TaxID=2792083 RepID=A0A931C5B8_9ACTN|nr:GGDEF domain-containing protein [Actinoplanes aureus]
MAFCVAMRLYLDTSGHSELVIVVPYLLVSAATPVAIWAGTVRHRPPHRAGWLLLAAAQVFYAVADVMTVLDDYISGAYVEPTPADVLYFAYYVLIAAAVLVFIRRRAPGWDLPSAVDALIVAVSAGLLTWLFLIEPLTADSELPLAAKLTQSAYPVLDLMLLVLAVRLVMGSGTRGPVLYLLLSSLTLMLAVDTAYAVQGVIDGAGVNEAYLDTMWMVSLGLLGAAALHPGIRHFDQRSGSAIPDASPGRLAVLTVAVLMAPGVQLIQHIRGEDVSVPLVSAACAIMFLLVMGRMYGLVTAQRRAAVTDSLTGLHTRRYFTEALAVECRRAARSGHDVGLLIIDVDHFKRVNDTYGHPAGDRVLREVADRLKSATRAGSVLARYGGEEFVVLAPDTGGDTLLDLAERLRMTISGLPIEAGDQALLSVTASVGAATALGRAADPDALMNAADEALYVAKAAGRNRSVAATPDRVGPCPLPNT